MLAKLKKALFGSQESSENGPLKESRFHPRYGMESLAFLALEFPASHFLKIRDISYGGFALSPRDRLEDEVRGTLHLFEQTCSILARKVHEDKAQVGFQFVHEDAHVLVFLRSFLEDLRCGSTLTLLHPDLIKESQQKNYNFILRGEGPIDLFMDYSNGTLHTALMTQRSNRDYNEIRWHREVLQTGRAVDEPGVAPRIIAHAQPDPNILKKALQTLAGFTVTSRTGLPALTEFYRLMEKSLPTEPWA